MTNPLKSTNPLNRLLMVAVPPLLLWVYITYGGFWGGLAAFVYSAMVFISAVVMGLVWAFFSSKTIYRLLDENDDDGSFKAGLREMRATFAKVSQTHWRILNYVVDVGMIIVLFHYGKYMIGGLTFIQLVLAVGGTAAILKGPTHDDEYRLL